MHAAALALGAVLGFGVPVELSAVRALHNSSLHTPSRRPEQTAQSPSRARNARRRQDGEPQIRGKLTMGPGGDTLPAGLGRPSVTANRASTPPVIDGGLDDPAWKTATRVTEFVQERPVEGVPATEQTEVLIAYDSRHIYFGIYAHYSDPSLIRANRVDRDQSGRDDTLSVFFDPFLDRQRAYVFSVNGYGVQSDSIMGGFGRGGGPPPGGGRGGPGPGGGGPGGGFGDGDTSWDALFFSSGRLVDDGWTAEMAIPFKSLRYPARGEGESHRWGFQIRRDIESKNESVVWAPVSRDVMGFISQMGTLDGMRNLSISHNVEILPTFTAIRAGSLDKSTGQYNTLDTRPEGGLNVKYGITSNLTADFTANPDFSQIESDLPQIQVNQRFPLFYPERRPFFLEGQEIFQIPGPVTIVHTRTIVDPRLGGKLSGKVGKTTLGVLFADDEAPGNLDDRTDPLFGKSAYVFMGRVRYDLYPESHVGIITTDREFMDGYSRLGGVDGQFRIGRNHRVSFRYLASDRRDQAGARKSGPLLDVAFRKEGRSLSYGVVHYEIHPEFGTATGFVRRVDMKQTNLNAGYRWWPESWIVNWGPRFMYSRNYDYGGILQDEDANASINFQFDKNISLNAGLNWGMERYRDIDFDQTRFSFGGGVNTSRRISFGGFINSGDQIRFIENPFNGRGTNVGTFINLRPFSRLQSQINVSSSRLVDPRDKTEVFSVKILRALTTYQFTDRLLARNITEYNSFDRTVGLNLLVTYRVNSGTVFYVGYDDHYRQANLINSSIFTKTGYERTNRAIFTKLQYLFRL